MAIGGFNNQGGNLSLAEFERYVVRGEIHYYVGATTGGAGAGPGGGGTSTAIANWVKSHYTPATFGGQTVYDLSGPTG